MTPSPSTIDYNDTNYHDLGTDAEDEPPELMEESEEDNFDDAKSDVTRLYYESHEELFAWMSDTLAHDAEGVKDIHQFLEDIGTYEGHSTVDLTYSDKIHHGRCYPIPEELGEVHTVTSEDEVYLTDSHARSQPTPAPETGPVELHITKASFQVLCGALRRILATTKS